MTTKSNVSLKSVSQTASRQITENLLRRIIEDEFPAGGKLPTERELALEYGVNRHVIREALTRLEAIDLITIRQGSGIYVKDLQLTGGLELFDMLLRRPDGSINEKFLQDALDFRDGVFRNVIKLAAKNRTDHDLDDLKAALSERKAALGDVKKLARIDFHLLKILSVSAHNQVYTLVFNTMNKFIPRMHPIETWERIDQDKVQLIVEKIYEAIEHKEPEIAELLVARMMNLIRKVTLDIKEDEGASSSPADVKRP